MKISFTDPERQWLHRMVSALIRVAHKGNQKLISAAGKMRYKFDGPASYVNLTQRERALLMAIASHRRESLQTSPSEERDITSSILFKLEGPTDEAA